MATIPLAGSPARADFDPLPWRPPATELPPHQQGAATALDLGGGIVWRVDRDTGTEFADVGGRPLGLAFAPDGTLLVANHGIGLQRITSEGTVELLLTEVDGEPLAFANELAVSTRYRLLEFDLGTVRPEPRVLIDLPGTPDDLTVDGAGNLLVALYDPSAALDRLVLPWSATREVFARLPTEWFVNHLDPLTGSVLVLGTDGSLLAHPLRTITP